MCFAPSFDQLSKGLSTGNSPSPFYSYKIYRWIYTCVMQSALKRARMPGSSEPRGKPQDVAREATWLQAKIKLSLFQSPPSRSCFGTRDLTRLTGILKSELHEKGVSIPMRLTWCSQHYTWAQTLQFSSTLKQHLLMVKTFFFLLGISNITLGLSGI